MYSVIVVDDEASVRERIVSFLRKEAKSFRLLGEYENGYDALMYGVPQGPDLIITDVKMPFVNGLELIQNALRQRPGTHRASQGRTSGRPVDNHFGLRFLWLSLAFFVLHALLIFLLSYYGLIVYTGF